jgi:hypothetical protein
MTAPEEVREDREPTPAPVREKICESCGQAFECRLGACWCDDASLSDERRAQLRARYNDCLCPTCLTET